MKKYFITIIGLFLSVVLLQAQTDTMYIMKAGVIINKQSIKAEDVDSIVFYNPVKPGIKDPLALTCFPDAPNPEDSVNSDPLPIVEGKILSWTVSTDDDFAYTPPGKWVNVYGKTYYRYVERAQGAAIKVNQVAASAANILTSEQLKKISAIVSNQTKIETKGMASIIQSFSPEQMKVL